MNYKTIKQTLKSAGLTLAGTALGYLPFAQTANAESAVPDTAYVKEYQILGRLDTLRDIILKTVRRSSNPGNIERGVGIWATREHIHPWFVTAETEGKIPKIKKIGLQEYDTKWDKPIKRRPGTDLSIDRLIIHAILDAEKPENLYREYQIVKEKQK